MDPLSITSGALACLAAIIQTSTAITNFIRGCREARADLTVISRELSELGIVIELLKDDSDVADDRVIPEPIQRQILSILSNCKGVIGKIDELLEHHNSRTGPVRWVLSGKKDAASLRQSLEAHRGALGLALETVTLSITKDIKQDTTALRNDTTGIKEDTSQILAEIERLKQLVSANGDESSKFLLNRYLDNMTTYAETVCDETIRDYDSLYHSDEERSLPSSPVRDQGAGVSLPELAGPITSEGTRIIDLDRRGTANLDPDPYGSYPSNASRLLPREEPHRNRTPSPVEPSSSKSGTSETARQRSPVVDGVTEKNNSQRSTQQSESAEHKQLLRAGPEGGGVETHKIYLSRAASPHSASNLTPTATGLATDLSKPAETKSSYPIPEDGTPVIINTRGHKHDTSQTSLLIEYYEGGKSATGGGSSDQRQPSVRVRVAPSKDSRKGRSDRYHNQATERKAGKAADTQNSQQQTTAISTQSRRYDSPEPEVSGSMAGPASIGGSRPTYEPPPETPAGWFPRWDFNSQKYYFVQLSTGASQWEMPTDAGPIGSDTQAHTEDHPREDSQTTGAPSSASLGRAAPRKHPFVRAAAQGRRRPSSEPGSCSDDDHSDCGFEINARGNLVYVHHDRNRPAGHSTRPPPSRSANTVPPPPKRHLPTSSSDAPAGDSTRPTVPPSPKRHVETSSPDAPALIVRHSVTVHFGSYRGKVGPMEFSPDSQVLAFYIVDPKRSLNEVFVMRDFQPGQSRYTSYKLKFTSWLGSHEAKSVTKLSFYDPHFRLLAMQTYRTRIAQKALVEMWDYALDKRVKLPGSVREVWSRDSPTFRDWTTWITGTGGYVLTDTYITCYPFLAGNGEVTWEHDLPLSGYPRVNLVSLPSGAFIAAYGARGVNPPLLAFLDSKGSWSLRSLTQADEDMRGDDLLSVGQLSQRLPAVVIACVWGSKSTARWISFWCPREDRLLIRNVDSLKHPKLRNDSLLYGIKEVDSKLFFVRQVLFKHNSFLPGDTQPDVRLLPIVVDPVPRFEVSPDGKTLAIPSPVLQGVLLYDLPPIPSLSKADVTPVKAEPPYRIQSFAPTWDKSGLQGLSSGVLSSLGATEADSSC